MKKVEKKNEQRTRIKQRIRAKVFGSAERPRLSVFRSNKAFSAQIIDDTTSKTLVSISDMQIKAGTKTVKAETSGKTLAKLAIEKGITKVVFDRNGFKYTGRIEAFAKGAREGGLIF